MSHCCGCVHPQGHATVGPQAQRGDGLFATLFKLMLLYAVLVFGSGTLINTGHPVAIEVGKLIQVVTFIDPAITWADRSDLDSVANGLRILAGGVPVRFS